MKSLTEIKKIAVTLFFLATTVCTFGQQNDVFNGIIKEAMSGHPIPFASVVVLNPGDSSMITGTVSGPEGNFTFEHPVKENTILQIRHMSYQTKTLNWEPSETQNERVILLDSKSVTMEELVVVGERIKVKNQGSKTTYFMNKQLKKATHSGTDVLTQLPGIQMDLMRNLSLEGSGNVVLMVDGRERDLQYISQLTANAIDKIEVSDVAGADMEADASGVINVLLKEKNRGFSGSVLADIPTSDKEVYLFPNYSLQYDHRKLSLHTSYTGAISNFDIINTSTIRFGDAKEIFEQQKVRQNNWSHRFNFGVDYSFNEQNRISYFGYYNPYSQELNGHVIFESEGTDAESSYWSAKKEDTDINRRTFHSLYYKHSFNPESQLELEVSYYTLAANNTTNYFADSLSGSYPSELKSQVKPVQHSVFVKADYSSKLSEQWNLKTGLKATFREMTDKTRESYNYTGQVLAAYGSTSYATGNLGLNAGVRVESATSEYQQQFDYVHISILPQASITYDFTSAQKIKLSYSQSLYRPNVYQLNPVAFNENPMMLNKGNPELKPGHHENLFLEHSIRFDNNFLATRIFYSQTKNAIQNLLTFNGNNLFESTTQNLGDITRYGLQLKGSLKIGKKVSLNPYFRVFRMEAEPNSFENTTHLNSFNRIAYASGLSAIASFAGGYSATLRFQYSSPNPLLQTEVFSDALYFMSVDKSISDKLKVGLTTALPFDKSFNYYGNEIKQNALYSLSEGTINTSGFPVWLKVSYRFGSKKTDKSIQREKENIEQIKRKGF
ncbi:MAG: TonB-dependent receptor [Bacteroidales bacterium]|nr:TonB-dependent receptor [Bacteroidales bacterium]MCF8333468.1 TonB-dependent receptor [Bacteroidales bacterium]